MKPLSLSRAAA